MAIAGPVEQVMTLETGSGDRQANMQVFAKTALQLLLKNLVAELPSARRDDAHRPRNERSIWSLSGFMK